jgi:N-acyl-D-aspartate/D-glutamate deacylase
MDASQCTYVLHLCARHWVRDTGLLDVGRAVHKLSRRRRVVHLADRGVVALGYFADVNVADRQGLELQAPDMQSDLPSGGPLRATSPRLRLHPRHGQVLIGHDKLTEARSGQLVLPPEITRSPRCTSHAARALRALSLPADGRRNLTGVADGGG